MRRSRLILALAVLAATAVLFSLGMWQVRRLAWKEALIATLEIRRHGLPAPLGEIEARWRQTGDVDYMALAAAGTFRHDLEQYYYTTRDGTVGWDVFTPLQLADGRMLFVDRGFVPDADRDPATRAAGQLSGDQTVAGLARNALVEKPNRFVPDNEPANRIFYWRNLTQMAAAAGIAQNLLVPFSLDAGPAAIPGGLPRGGGTIVELPNNHLQYAITWFGLALACLVVGAVLLRRPSRRDS